MPAVGESDIRGATVHDDVVVDLFVEFTSRRVWTLAPNAPRQVMFFPRTRETAQLFGGCGPSYFWSHGGWIRSNNNRVWLSVVH
mmetsp:Transcript_4735/g.10672  ORF Transcript_4735/g.10672 Transcript_4735/m.10672 type:complete len:84 (+) Transcript_4735:263-514(+)